MRKKINHFFFRFTWAEIKSTIVFVVLTGLAIVGLMLVLSGCSSSHKSTSDLQNDNQLKKTDSGTVKKSEATEKSDKQYTKESWYLPGRVDTINNIFKTTEKLLQPIYYTRETGTEKSERILFNYDSAWRASVDSINKDKVKVATESKTEVLSNMQLILIMAGIALFFKIIPLPKISFTKN